MRQIGVESKFIIANFSNFNRKKKIFTQHHSKDIYLYYVYILIKYDDKITITIFNKKIK